MSPSQVYRTSLLDPNFVSPCEKVVERKRGSSVEHDKCVCDRDRLEPLGRGAQGPERGQNVKQYLEPECRPVKRPLQHRRSHKHENQEQRNQKSQEFVTDEAE